MISVPNVKQDTIKRVLLVSLVISLVKSAMDPDSYAQYAMGTQLRGTLLLLASVNLENLVMMSL